MEEAKAQPALATQWESADINRDNRLDQAEFAAFEIADPGARPGQMQGSDTVPQSRGSAAPNDMQEEGSDRPTY